MINLLVVILVALATFLVLGTIEMLINNQDDENILKYIWGSAFLIVAFSFLLIGARL